MLILIDERSFLYFFCLLHVMMRANGRGYLGFQNFKVFHHRNWK